MPKLIGLAASLVLACSGSTKSGTSGLAGSGGSGGTGEVAASGGTAGTSATGGTAGDGATGGATPGGNGGEAGADLGGSAASAGTGTGTGPICDAPALVAIAKPDQVVGDGTPGSCTEAALQAAATAGGKITFACGAAPITLTVTTTITFTKETVLDGANLVTLSGGKSARILYLDSAYDQTTPRLTVERLAFRDGMSPAGGDDTAQGGGAIYRDGGSLTVLACDFEDNHAPATGQDVAGGAIYGFGGGETVIANSTFRRNSASDGGAVGSLNGDLTVIDSLFVDNAATGTDGNPGNGGCGGAIYMDGGAETTTLCGDVIQGNTAGAIGGGFFRVSNSEDGTLTMDKSAVSDNVVAPVDSGNAGGMYLEGLAITMTASTVANNEAFYNGGLWISKREANLTNVTIAGNTAFGSNGGGLWLAHEPTGTLTNVTIADNHSTADGQVAGAIFGDGLTLKNTLIAGNSAQYSPGCDGKHASGGGNLQWPDGALCSDAPTVADPELGALRDNGGPTETMALPATSPALRLGTDCPPTDQRGRTRSEPCTAGAFELGGPLEVP
ncbi:MAG TPA: choice-of-anchor Q domain-containing protein [Polyangiaceae bacterium]|nr:choice-of-anchor Q domain-containing protein [Polyangiaceae bacterium]